MALSEFLHRILHGWEISIALTRQKNLQTKLFQESTIERPIPWFVPPIQLREVVGVSKVANRQKDLLLDV